MSEVKIPEGYKQTEIGVIPKDWEVEPLKSLLKEPPKYGINAAAVPLTADLPVYIRITDISEDGYYSPEKVVGVNSPFSSSYILNEGDIVLARTGASVGKSYLYRKEDGTLIYAGFLIKVSPNEKQLNPKYLHQYLKTEHYWAWVIVNSMRSGQPGINGNEYGRLSIPLPSIEEQAAIATALSDADNLIQSLEKLIAKKEAIKTGTMQQLLTGKTRLPEFATREDGSPKRFKQTELGRIPEDWELLPAKEMTSFIGGYSFSSNSAQDNGVRWIKIANVGVNKIKWDAKSYLPYSFSEMHSKYLLKENDVVIALTRPILSESLKIAKLSLCDIPSLLNQRVAKLEMTSKGDANFAYYALQTSSFIAAMNLAMAGTDPPNIGTKALSKIQVIIPSKKEQTAIATVLSDMDTEIQALQQRLEKTKDIKQGMMQQLLTGKVRLAH